MQIPSWDGRLFDLEKAAQSKTYCDEVKGIAGQHGLAITELSTHLQGQLVAVHPAYDEAFDAFAPPAVHGKPEGAAGLGGRAAHDGAPRPRAISGSTRMSPSRGALAWPFVYPWPQRPPA